MKYDDVDFHDQEAERLGRGRDEAFTHIGFMFVWLTRHDMVKTGLLPSDIAAQVADGSLTPNEVRDLIDGQLLGEMLSPMARRFLDFYYPIYVEQDYPVEFADLPTYGVPDDAEHQRRIDLRIDAAWQKWQLGKLAAPEVAVSEPSEPTVDDLFAALGCGLKEGRSAKAGKSATSISSSPAGESRTHLAPKLESLIEMAVGPVTEIRTRTARTWDSSVLNGVLKRMKVDPSSVIVATATAAGSTPLRLELLQIPDRAASVLADSLAPYFRERSLEWAPGELGSVPAWRATWRRPGTPPYHMLWFALSGHVLHVGGSDEVEVERVGEQIARRLPQ